MKMSIILAHQAANELRSPNNRQLRDIGHSLVDAYEKCKIIARDYDADATCWFESNTHEYRLLEFLSKFADGARYYNLDQLAENNVHDDPLANWYSVHKEIADHYISISRQELINSLAIQHCDKFHLYGWEQGLDGQFRTTVDATFLHELFRRSTRYCVWAVIRILKPFYSLLVRLCDAVHALETGSDGPMVPYMVEFFPFFLCDRRTSTRRSSWITLYG